MNKKISINHLRVIKFFGGKKDIFKVTDYEKFLNKFVSLPTARKIIRELVELKLVEKISSNEDKRIRYLKIIDTNFEKLI